MAANYKWTIRFSILTPILLVICIFVIGGGHGWYTPAILLFPWATFNTIWQDHLLIPLICVGTLQFILYGVLIDKFRGRNNQKMVVAGIIITHIILAIIILALRSSTWR